MFPGRAKDLQCGVIDLPCGGYASPCGPTEREQQFGFSGNFREHDYSPISRPNDPRPVKFLQILLTALKRLASAVQLRPWPPCFQSLIVSFSSFTCHVSPAILGLIAATIVTISSEFSESDFPHCTERSI